MSDLATAAAALSARSFADTAGPIMAATLTAAGAPVQRAVKDAARRHRRTGRLESKVTATARGDGLGREIRVHAGGPTAHLVVGGTAPHEIAPVRSQAIAMAAPGGGLIGFASVVHHPGTRADPFVARGVAAAAGDIHRLTDQAVDKLAAELAHEIERRR